MKSLVVLWSGAVLVAALFLFSFSGGAAAQTTTFAIDLSDDRAAGLALYEVRCANCHGPAGMGDGVEAELLPVPPTALASRQYLQTVTPNQLFNVVTNGILASGMPPFGPQSSNPLSTAERWQTIAALYDLGTDEATIAQGEQIYQASCQECHGPQGEGGEEGPALTSLAYWLNSSDQLVFSALHDEIAIPEHDLGLSVNEQWAVTDYMRAAFGSPLMILQPLPQAAISGQVRNATTGEAASDLVVRLNGFTEDLDPALTITATVGLDGNYHFDLEEVSPAWFYQVNTTYRGIDFSSDFGQLSHAQPDLELPVTIFEQTSDPDVVRVEQLHIIIDFASDQIQVGQLYLFSNNSQAIYVGEQGDAALGTLRISLPPGAENVAFERAIGSLDSFMPAREVVPGDQAQDYLFTAPLRPGQSSLGLLARYTLPYRSGMALAHPLHHHVAGASVILPDVGVTLSEEGLWSNMGRQAIGQNNYLTYGRSNMLAGSQFSLTLSGRPAQAAAGGAVLARDETAELMVGGLALLLVVALAAFAVYRWRQEDEPLDPAELLQAIADLDDEFEAGEIEEFDYLAEREALKEELRESWRGKKKK